MNPSSPPQLEVVVHVLSLWAQVSVVFANTQSFNSQDGRAPSSSPPCFALFTYIFHASSAHSSRLSFHMCSSIVWVASQGLSAHTLPYVVWGSFAGRRGRNQKTVQVTSSLTISLQKTDLENELVEDCEDLWSWWCLVRESISWEGQTCPLAVHPARLLRLKWPGFGEKKGHWVLKCSGETHGSEKENELGNC